MNALTIAVLACSVIWCVFIVFVNMGMDAKNREIAKLQRELEQWRDYTGN